MNRRGFLSALGIGAVAAPLAAVAAKHPPPEPVRAGMTNFGDVSPSEREVWARNLWCEASRKSFRNSARAAEFAQRVRL